jgi:hypothetical protein
MFGVGSGSGGGGGGGGGNAGDTQSVHNSPPDSDESPQPSEGDPDSRRSSITKLSFEELLDHVRHLDAEAKERRSDFLRQLKELEVFAALSAKQADDAKRLAEEEKRRADDEKRRADLERERSAAAEAALRRFMCTIV